MLHHPAGLLRTKPARTHRCSPLAGFYSLWFERPSRPSVGSPFTAHQNVLSHWFFSRHRHAKNKSADGRTDSVGRTRIFTHCRHRNIARPYRRKRTSARGSLANRSSSARTRQQRVRSTSVLFADGEHLSRLRRPTMRSALSRVFWRARSSDRAKQASPLDRIIIGLLNPR